MKSLAATVLIAFVALPLIGVAVFVAGDTQTFVPAPEAEVENFMRPLIKERYEVAMNHMTSRLREQSSVADLRERRRRLFETWGDVDQVSGEAGEGENDGGTARATAVLRTRDGREGRVQLWLSRESGVWRISGFGDLTR